MAARTATLGRPMSTWDFHTEWLDQHRPERKEKILAAIRGMRGGKLNDAQFGSRMRGDGPIAENIRQMFEIYSRKEGLNKKSTGLSSGHFSRPGDQMTLSV